MTDSKGGVEEGCFCPKDGAHGHALEHVSCQPHLRAHDELDTCRQLLSNRGALAWTFLHTLLDRRRLNTE